MIKSDINHFPDIKKLQLNNSKVRLVGSMGIPSLMDIFLDDKGYATLSTSLIYVVHCNISQTTTVLILEFNNSIYLG